MPKKSIANQPVTRKSRQWRNGKVWKSPLAMTLNSCPCLTRHVIRHKRQVIRVWRSIRTLFCPATNRTKSSFHWVSREQWRQIENVCTFISVGVACSSLTLVARVEKLISLKSSATPVKTKRSHIWRWIPGTWNYTGLPWVDWSE